MNPNKTAKLVLAVIKAKKEATHVIEHLDKKGIDALCECLFNICYSHHLNLPTYKKNKLRKKMCPQEKLIKKIFNPSLTPTLRKKLLKKVSELNDILKLAWPAIESLCHHEEDSISA